MSYGLRLALIDSDEFVREGRVLLLQSQPETQIVFQTSDATTALVSVLDYLLDVIIVDSRIPGWNTDKYIAELAARLTDVGNDAQILVTASFGSPDFELSCLRAGASAFATTEQGGAALLRQVRSIASGERAVPRKHLDDLLSKASTGAPAPHPGLAVSLEQMDQSQLAVVRAMLEGFTDGQISKNLELTKYRVSKFIESLRASNGFRTRVQLAIELLGFGAF